MLLSPQAERNWESVCSVLKDVLESQSHRQLFALELGSGTGQQIIRFAQKMPFVIWQPSDIKEDSLERFVPFRKCLPCWRVSIVMCDRKIYEHIPVKSMIYLNKWFVEVYGFDIKSKMKLVHTLLAVSRHILLQPKQRRCYHLFTWMPVIRGRNGQDWVTTPVTLLFPLIYCNTAPSKQPR